MAIYYPVHGQPLVEKWVSARPAFSLQKISEKIAQLIFDLVARQKNMSQPVHAKRTDTVKSRIIYAFVLSTP